MPDSAFVICQVGDEDSDVRRRADEIYNYIVLPVTQNRGLTATRSDKDPTPGQVTVQIIRSLTSAAVVIADLTGRNPNVYYELGVAHSFGIPVVILVDTAASLSFDTSTERVIEIGSGERLGVAEAEKAKRKLQEALDVVLSDGYRASSLVSEAAGTQSLDALAPDNPIAQELAYVRDRLELVVRNTQVAASQRDDYGPDARFLYSIVRGLAENQRLTTATLQRLEIDLDDAPDENDLRESLERLIPEPRPRVKPQQAPPADDDIPF